MGPRRTHGWVAALLLALSLGFLPVSAEAIDTCREIKGGSSADALGEEFPERVKVYETDGLGEEFPELGMLMWGLAWALGEEFPERLVILGIHLDALGEEFPE